MRTFVSLLSLAALLGAGHGAFIAHDAPAVDVFQPYAGLSPRYLLDGMPPIARRDSAGCSAGYHSCLDINSTLCCPNDRYCMIDPTSFAATCCSIGLTCSSPCNETQYECNGTSTVTVTQTQTKLVSGTATLTLTTPNTLTGAGITLQTITATITTTTPYLACCGRHCPATSNFRCASSFGGGCCQYGQTCGSSSQCIWTNAASTASDTATGTAVVSALPSSCTTGQVACASSLGGGCCDTGHTCTVVSDQVYCATASPTIAAHHSKLSSGAKAGIALGVVVGVGLFIGAATWLCIRRRRQNSADGNSRRVSALASPSIATHEYDDLQQSPRQGPRLYQQSIGAGGVPGSEEATSPGVRSWFRRNTASTNAANIVSPTTPGMATAPKGGATQDYFGPSATPGPFTAEALSAVSPHTGPGAGVPIQPDGPHHIVAPVEIDSHQRDMGDSSAMPRSTPGPGYEQPPAELPQAQQHFELYGSDVAGVAPAESADAPGATPAVASSLPMHMDTACDSPTVPRSPHPFKAVYEKQDEK